MTRNLDHSRILAAPLFATGLLLASIGSALAEVHYVDVNGTNAALPYTNWAAAAPSQDSLHYHYFKERRPLKLERNA